MVSNRIPVNSTNWWEELFCFVSPHGARSLEMGNGKDTEAFLACSARLPDTCCNHDTTGCCVHVSAKKMDKNKKKGWHMSQKEKKIPEIHSGLPLISHGYITKCEHPWTAQKAEECHFSMYKLLHCTKSVLLVKGKKGEWIFCRDIWVESTYSNVVLLFCN